MPKIFALGVTGYIGGDAFYATAQKHPEYKWALLVRDPHRAGPLFMDYPNIRLVHGNLDDSELIVKETEAADIVCNWASADHPNAAKAIVAGLKKRSTPGFYIHTSGTGILTISDIHKNAFGKESSRLYNDFDRVAEVTSLPDDAQHRDVDKIVLASNAESELVRTAIVCPPCIYGEGRGPDNRRSIQVPELIRFTLERGQAFQVEQGRNRWGNVHIQDLSKIYKRLIEEAAKTQEGVATWGQEGYYFAEAGEHYWGNVSQEVGKIAHQLGLISTDNVLSLGAQEVDTMHPFGSLMLGTNSRGEAIRARKLFRWKPTKPSLTAELPSLVQSEARRLKKM